MSRHSKIWLVIAVLFSLVNAAGTVWAAVAGEVLHTAVHSVLLLAGVAVTWRLAPRRVASY